MFIRYRTPAIIIKKIDRGEADQLLIAYTKEFGRVEIAARSIRKITSKLRSATEFVSILEVEFIQGKTCKTLTDAVIINSLGGIRNNLRKSAVLYQICRFTEDIVKEQQQDARVWDLFYSALFSVNSAIGSNCDAVFHYFVWHLFGISGWKPSFGRLKKSQFKPGEFTVDAENSALVDFFINADIVRGCQMRLTARQNKLLLGLAENYLALVTN
ncbi:MAG: DNA repair protein RecO [Candidatus Paceibacterota bacterium]